jgi:hypothetical protein
MIELRQTLDLAIERAIDAGIDVAAAIALLDAIDADCDCEPDLAAIESLDQSFWAAGIHDDCERDLADEGEPEYYIVSRHVGPTMARQDWQPDHVDIEQPFA